MYHFVLKKLINLTEKRLFTRFYSLGSEHCFSLRGKLWQHAWSSGKVQDSWSLDHQCREFEPRYGKRVCILGQDTYSQFASLTRAYLGPVGCGECYNQSADGACACPVANCPRWSQMVVMISWRGNRQQRFGKALYKSNYYYNYYY